MIQYHDFKLDNGLRLLVHEDKTTPLAVVSLTYNVGSRDEDPDKTGFAHLFEHLMFGGSKNIPNYDEPLQKVGGDNNAFTSPDITNYHISLPAVNLETAFWLESDRMLELAFDEKSLEVQKKVVVEEFKQRYLNQPYGSAWLKLRPLAYQVHPYRWATIGKEIEHIEQATLEDVKAFFKKFYNPTNAVLVVAGNVNHQEVYELAQKWFAPIAAGPEYIRELPQEPSQEETRSLNIEEVVPLKAIYKAYHIPGRLEDDYYAVDLLSDVLGRGKSSRLHQELVKDKKHFSKIHAYLTGSTDPGLLVITGQLNGSLSFEEAEAGIDKIIKKLQKKKIGDNELEKVKNQAESTIVIGEVDLLQRAINLGYSAILGDPNLVNSQTEFIQAVSSLDIKKAARHYLRADNSSVLYYHPISGRG